MSSSKRASSETILALDLATRCGWAVLRGSTLVDSGTWVLWRGRKNEHRAKRWETFRELMAAAIAEYQPHVVAFERVRRHVGTNAAHVYGGLLAQIEIIDMTHAGAFEVVPMEVSTWRKVGVGNGRALKSEVVAFVSEHFDITPGTDDEAEAIAIAEAVRRTRAQARKKGTR